MHNSLTGACLFGPLACPDGYPMLHHVAVVLLPPLTAGVLINRISFNRATTFATFAYVNYMQLASNEPYVDVISGKVIQVINDPPTSIHKYVAKFVLHKPSYIVFVPLPLGMWYVSKFIG